MEVSNENALMYRIEDRAFVYESHWKLEFWFNKIVLAVSCANVVVMYTQALNWVLKLSLCCVCIFCSHRWKFRKEQTSIVKSIRESSNYALSASKISSLEIYMLREFSNYLISIDFKLQHKIFYVIFVNLISVELFCIRLHSLIWSSDRDINDIVEWEFGCCSSNQFNNPVDKCMLCKPQYGV